MEQNKEQDFSSTPIPFRNHTALLLGVALPYLHPAYRHPMELALKFLEFSETLRLFQEFHMRGGPASFFSENVSFTEGSGFFGLISRYITDLEGLLVSLSHVCTGDEKELIGMFLNLIRAKNFYDTYGDLLKSQFTDAGGLANLFSGLGDVGNLFSNLQTTDTTSSHPDAKGTANMPLPPASPFGADLSSMLNNDQKETLELLKSLFSDE